MRSPEEEGEKSVELREGMDSPAVSMLATPCPSPAPSSRRKGGASRMSEFQSILLEKISAPQRQDEDADCKFLLSLHPRMAKLSESHKLDFQFHCLQFFKNLENQQSHLPSTSFGFPTSQPFPQYTYPQQNTFSTIPTQYTTPFPSPIPSITASVPTSTLTLTPSFPHSGPSEEKNDPTYAVIENL